MTRFYRIVLPASTSPVDGEPGDAFEAYRDLVSLLRGITVLAPGGGAHLFSAPSERDRKMA